MKNKKRTNKDRQTLDVEVNYNVSDNSDDAGVKDCVRLMNENFTEKNKRDNKNQAINDMVENGFEIREPLGPRKINTKKAIQALWRVISILKPLDFSVHGEGAKPWEEKLMTGAVSTILKKGKYDSSFRDKGGAAMNMLMYGNGFRLIGPRESSGFPIEFTPIMNSNLYVDCRSTGFRSGNRPVGRAAVIFSGTWSQFVSYFPDAAKTAGPGRIPRNNSYYKETGESYLQRWRESDQLTEWCYYYDIENRAFRLFAGEKCTLLKESTGKDYPYVYKDEERREVPYIPISSYSCMPSVEGFYDHGLIEMLYDLILLYAGIFNQMSQSIEDNVSPLEFVNLPQGEESKFFAKLEMAYKERALGRRALIPITQGSASANGVSLQPFATSAMINEAEALFNRIDLEMKRLGIYLDELDGEGAGATATEILSNIEKSTQFTRQIMEFNASEVEFELNVTLDLAKKFIKSSDKTPLNLTTMLNVDGEKVRPDFMTLGLAKKTLTERHWFFRVNSRTGVIPSNTMRRAQLANSLPMLQPGTPTYNNVVRELTSLDDVDFVDEEQQPPQPPGGGLEGAEMSPEGGMPIPTEQGAQPGLAEGLDVPEEAARDEVRFRQLSEV